MRPLRLGQVAELLGVSRSTVRRLVDDGTLKGFRLPSGHRRVRLADVESLMSAPTGPVVSSGSLPAEPGGEQPIAKDPWL